MGKVVKVVGIGLASLVMGLGVLLHLSETLEDPRGVADKAEQNCRQEIYAYEGYVSHSTKVYCEQYAAQVLEAYKANLETVKAEKAAEKANKKRIKAARKAAEERSTGMGLMGGDESDQ